MNLISIKVLTPEGVYLEEDVYRIDVKTETGNIGILKGHIPTVSSLEINKLQVIDSNNKPTVYALHGGLLNVSKDEAVIITTAIESKDEIDKKRAIKAKSEAERLLSNIKDSDKDYCSAEAALKRALIRLKI